MSSTLIIHSFVHSQFTKIVSVVVLLSVFSLAACSEAKSNEKKSEKPHPITGLVIEPAQKNGVFYQLKDLATAIKAGKRQQKRVLIYFTCWACVNSRKMEDRILIDKEIQALLAENYLCFSAYVDDKQKIPGSDKSIGEKNMELQMDRFKSTSQPHFCILDESGNLINEVHNTPTVEAFLAFLEKGLK
jgi:thioredoxin-related protein